jgi:hypothetical protein
MQDYRINGIGVGNSPDNFTRSQNYEDFFARIGSGSENIHRIKNFITEEEATTLIALTETTSPQPATSQWSDMIWSNGETNEILNGYKERVMQSFRDIYAIDCKFCGGSYLVKWTESKKMNLHVDDLGDGKNQISAVLYLNDDYVGGNINFPTHNLSIKPENYELLIFPGNLNYAHEVQEITNGSRFTIPYWAEIV